MGFSKLRREANCVKNEKKKLDWMSTEDAEGRYL
jgi:hypothetical protein